jgi:hypothetical protein
LFNVIAQQFQGIFYARGIIYLARASDETNEHRRWNLIKEGSSDEGVVNT